MPSDGLDPVVIGLAVAVITGLFTLLGIAVSGRQTREQLKLRLESEHQHATDEALRTRLEELYCLVQRWAGAVVVHHATYRKVMDGVLTYNQALDIELERKLDLDVSRMMMLAELYFPAARPQLAAMINFRDQAASIHGEFRELYRVSGQPSPSHSVAVTDALEKFNGAVDEYKSSLAQYARNV